MAKIIRNGDEEYEICEYKNALVLFRCERRTKQSDMRMIFYEYQAGGRFVVKNTVAKEIPGSWNVLSFNEVFCDSVASNQLIFLLGKSPGEDLSQHIQEACFIVLKNFEDFDVIPLSVQLPQRKEDSEILLVNGPALFLFDKRTRKVIYINIPLSKSSRCCMTDLSQLSCTVEGARDFFSWDFIQLFKIGFNYPDKFYEFVVVNKFLMPSDERQSFELQRKEITKTVAIMRLKIEGALCDRCLRVRPVEISLETLDLKFTPANLSDCIKCVYPMMTNNFRPCGSCSLPVLIFTDIGQLMYVSNGEIQNICDLPQLQHPHIMKCDWKIPVVVLKDQELSNAYVIDLNSFKIMKSFSDIISVVIGDLIKSGKNQIFLLKSLSPTGEETLSQYVLIKDELDLKYAENEELEVMNNDEMGCSGESAVDLFSSLMDVDDNPVDHSSVKRDLFAMLQNKILQEKIAVRKAEDLNANYDAVIKKSVGAIRAMCSNKQESPVMEEDGTLIDLCSVNLNQEIKPDS